MKVYSVKEMYYTLQGEGAQAGRAAVFCRFAGCNLWSGLEVDRDTATCRFCDTDFVGTNGPGGGKFSGAASLASAIALLWPDGCQGACPLVVFTGGEPLLQLDAELVDAMHAEGFEVAIETNGTLRTPPGIDWVCVSPKAGAPLVVTTGSELKLVYPQADLDPETFAAMDFRHFFLQPMDGVQRERNTRLAIDYCMANPRWRLSVQTHKVVGIA